MAVGLALKTDLLHTPCARRFKDITRRDEVTTLLQGTSLPPAVPTAVSPLPTAEEQPPSPDDPGPASPVSMPDAEDRLGLAVVRGKKRTSAPSPVEEEGHPPRQVVQARTPSPSEEQPAAPAQQPTLPPAQPQPQPYGHPPAPSWQYGWQCTPSG